MKNLAITVKNGGKSFIPGQTVKGQVQWDLANPPRKACLRLIWFTVGKGTEDAGLVESREFDEPYASDSRNFEFKIPAGPYSFSGLLISLAWALELELDKECLQYDIVVSPTGKEISLYSGANS